MLRILEEISAGRQETMTELRTDINALVRVLAEQTASKARSLKIQSRDPSQGLSATREEE